jgi:hypothetical protein
MVSFVPIAATGIGAILLYVVRYISYKLSVRGKLPTAVCHRGSLFLRSLTLSQPRSEASWWLGHDYLVAKNEVGVEYRRWTWMLGPVFRIKCAIWQHDVVNAGP